MPAPDRRILLISGSLRARSTNTALLRTACEVAPAGVEATLYEGMRTLPHFDPDDDAEGAPVHPAVAALRSTVVAADALLFSTPEYAGALPGAFKNLLEWTVGDASTYRKPVAWINVSARGPSGGVNAHASLRIVLGYVHAEIVEDACAHIPVAHGAVEQDGLVADAEVRARVVDVLTALQAGIHHQMR